MNINVSLPLDESFLRRECPTCEREFKWFTEETEDRPEDAAEPDVYFCPYCGVSAPTDHWWTRAQLDYMQGAAAGHISDFVNDELKAMSRRIKSPLIDVKFKPGPPPPAPPPLEEPSDMVIVEPPCHPYEPMKVMESWDEPLHCLVCGNPFRV